MTSKDKQRTLVECQRELAEAIGYGPDWESTFLGTWAHLIAIVKSNSQKLIDIRGIL